MRKFLALVLALCLPMAAFAGCKDSTPTASSSTAAPSTPAASSESTNPAVKQSYTLTDPVNVILLSQAAGSDDYIKTASEATMLANNLPKGSNVTQETLSSGCSSVGYLIEAGMGDLATGQNTMSGTIGMDDKPAYTKINALFASTKYAFVAQLATADFVKKTGYSSLREVIENKYPARICAEPVGSSDYVSFIYMMDALGCSIDEFKGWGGTITFTGGSACCDMLQDGQADMMVAHTTAASSNIVELCMSADIKCSGLDEEMIKEMVKRGYAPVEIPVGTFNQFPEAVPSVCQASSMIVSSELSNETAYAITKILVENKDKLSEDIAGYRDLSYKTMVDTAAMVVPMHPGAKAYFQNIGVLDANGTYIGEPK